MKFFEAYVRSRLAYSVQAWQLTISDINKVESVWNNFLRRMVEGVVGSFLKIGCSIMNIWFILTCDL